jgi:hypothetical protein
MSANNSIAERDEEDAIDRNQSSSSEPDDLQVDLQSLADKVYQLMRQEIRLECARNGEILWRR